MPPRNEELEREWREAVKDQLRDHENRIRAVEVSSGAMAVKIAGIGVVLAGVFEVAKHYLLK